MPETLYVRVDIPADVPVLQTAFFAAHRLEITPETTHPYALYDALTRLGGEWSANSTQSLVPASEAALAKFHQCAVDAIGFTGNQQDVAVVLIWGQNNEGGKIVALGVPVDLTVVPTHMMLFSRQELPIAAPPPNRDYCLTW